MDHQINMGMPPKSCVISESETAFRMLIAGQVYQKLGVHLPDSGYRGLGSLEKISMGRGPEDMGGVVPWRVPSMLV